jgi:hypothetical protein
MAELTTKRKVQFALIPSGLAMLLLLIGCEIYIRHTSDTATSHPRRCGP